MKTATAYQRESKIFLVPEARTTAGVRISATPVEVIDHATGIDSTDLGKVVISVLNKFQDSVPHPTDWKSITIPFLKPAGVKSWREFVKSAKSVGIEFEKDKIRLIPMKNLGAKEGFAPLTEKSVTVQLSADEIGKGLLERLDACE